MTTIPNELKITINTSIPGFQNIRYKPNMTIKDEKSNSVQFNPLVKLQKSVIASMPKNIQVKEFFNSGLFYSLINAHGLVKTKTLVEATKEGFVDNNIRVTLDTLFPVNSVLYIAGQPYVIADVLWKKGDWKIDKKVLQVPQVNFSRINDPYLFTNLAKEQLVTGESELQALPKEVIFGSAYVMPPSPNVGPPVPPVPPPPGPNVGPPLPPPGPPLPNNNPFGPTPPLPAKPLVRPPLPPKPLGPLGPPANAPPVPIGPPIPIPPPKPPKRVIPKPNPVYPPLPPIPINNNLPIRPPLPLPPIPPVDEEDEENIPPSTYTVKLLQSKNGGDFRNYFLSNDYYDMVNYIVQNMNKASKGIIDNILIKTTGISVKPSKNLSKTAYNVTVNGTKIYKNAGAGDCFFIAVADGINYQNLNANPSDKIYYNNYGKGNMIFTQQILRKIVADFILKLNVNIINDILQASEVNANFLNTEFINFKNDLLGVMSDEEKLASLNNYLEYLYSSNDSFLIKKPNQLNETILNPLNYFNVFSTIKSRNEIYNYILSSDYWANYIAIDAIISVLGLNIIAVEKTPDNKIRVPYINTRYNWNKYMFLYYQNAHYELISFDYILQKIQKQPVLRVKKYTKTIVIFDKNDDLYPPLWLIFLIFGSFYINILNEKDKQNFTLLPLIFNSLNVTFNSIMNVPDNDSKLKFLDLFDEYFEPSILRARRYKSLTGSPDTDDMIEKPILAGKFNAITFGGAPPNLQMSNPNSQSNPNNLYNSYNQNITQRFNNTSQPYNRFIPNNQRLSLNRSINDEPVSNISYYITIDIQLKKGTTLSTSDLINLKCNQQFNKIRKSYSDLRGLKYSMLPDYNNLPTFKQKSDKQQLQNQSNTKKVGGYKNIKNITRKII
jgi:hypothetical protein